MDIELTDLEEILLYLKTTSLEPHDDYTSEFTYKDQKILYKYIKELQQENDKLKEQQKEFINYLEDEKNRLARECSHIYEDGLGRTRLVNKDIFDEIDNILQKYREIIGDDK